MDTKLVLVALFALLAFCTVVSADISSPTMTNVYFQKEGKPYTAPVDYTVNCYGYNTGIPPQEKEPGTYTPEVVFTYSVSCPEYGCKIYNPYYLNYRHIDYCDLGGNAGETSFKISNWSNSPRPEDCEDVKLPYSMSDGEGYYQSTPEYENCTNIAYAIYCNQTTAEFGNCVAEQDAELAKCKKYLHKLTDAELAQIEKDDRGNDITYECQLTIVLPENVPPVGQPANPIPQPAPKQSSGDNTLVIAAVVILAAALIGLLFLKMRARPAKPKK